MSGYLLDTSVLSLFAPDRPPLAPSFRDWLARDGRRRTWHMPAIAAAEVQKGVAKLRRAGGVQRADRLETWLESLLGQFDERILAVDAKIARRAGEMEDAAIARGRNPGLSNILIAATAAENGLTVLTANSRHFEMLDAAFLNPLLERPAD